MYAFILGSIHKEKTMQSKIDNIHFLFTSSFNGFINLMILDVDTLSGADIRYIQTIVNKAIDSVCFYLENEEINSEYELAEHEFGLLMSIIISGSIILTTFDNQYEKHLEFEKTFIYFLNKNIALYDDLIETLVDFRRTLVLKIRN